MERPIVSLDDVFVEGGAERLYKKLLSLSLLEMESIQVWDDLPYPYKKDFISATKELINYIYPRVRAKALKDFIEANY